MCVDVDYVEGNMCQGAASGTRCGAASASAAGAYRTSEPGLGPPRPPSSHATARWAPWLGDPYPITVV
jgi:hypothetical protein